MLYDHRGKPIIPSESFSEPSSTKSESVEQEKEANSANKATSETPYKPPERSFSIDQSVATNEKHQKTYEEKNYRLQKSGLWIQGILCLVTGFAFAAAAWYANIAQKQQVIMQKQLETTDRPWVEISKADVAEFRFHSRVDNGMPMLDVRLKLRVANVGHSVATNVRLKTRLIFQMSIEPYMEIKQKQACEVADIMRITKEFVLFPGRDSGDRLYEEIGFDETIQDTDKLWIETGERQSPVDPALIGCVLYDIPSSRMNPHYTWFSYQFVRKLPNGQLDHRAFFIGEKVPTESLVLIDDLLGVTYVN
ncbi:MAG TPA: hypothetical protein VGG97_19125 [Bryobacteraceae bacterium]|jgi:hypothetical protein